MKNVHLRYKHKLADVDAIHWCKLHQWFVSCSPCYRYTSINCFSLLFWALLHCCPDFI